MNTLVSIIIPTKNSAQTLSACLRSIHYQSYPAIEIFVVDNGSSDATLDIAAKNNATVLQAGPERSAQRNKGAKMSKGEYLLFIDSDMELSPHVVEECVRAMQKNTAMKAITIPEESFGQGFWATCKSFERSLYVRIPWMNSARFFTQGAYEAIDGYDENISGGEDFDIHNQIVKSFGLQSIASVTAPIRHNEGNLALSSLLRKKYYYGTTIPLYGSKKHNHPYFSLQRNPLIRIQILLRALNYENFLLVLGTIGMKLGEFFAMGLGYLVTSISKRKAIR